MGTKDDHRLPPPHNYIHPTFRQHLKLPESLRKPKPKTQTKSRHTVSGGSGEENAMRG